ncbi:MULTISPECIES: glycosyltransferase family 2 protein [unclassified Crossiella]|uniref:glycosyltransferase family 2 protein n=1 Tax=unclassified Crossiella TaxID=2620835 RepID=UPI001FFF1177|nr:MULTISPECIES: glycosyltransferase family 2 protein [unclassified Crossiella]MCK2240819.1 glycosyltransferase family 2 protein [Crossiella sp. S99.2]MCK2254037.1 glycosyltransferase family 2 protein [Crossiella sp. S99.1]
MSPRVPAVVLAVVTYNSAADLPAFLDALPAALDGVPEWRLVVADNASSDGSADLLAELAPKATVLHTGGNLGYAAGINACLELAGPEEAVLVLNPDVRLESGAVRELLEVCADPAVGIAVPLVRHPDGHPESTLRRRPTPLRVLAEALLGGRAGSYGEQLPPGPARERIDWANGAALMLAPGVAHRVGRWRAELFLYSEETDYCRRVTDAGWRIRQAPRAHALHRGGEFGVSPALWAQLITNKVVHLATWESRRAAVAGWLALVFSQALRLPLRRGTHRRALRELLTGRARLLAGFPTNPAATAEVAALLAEG